MKATSSRRQIIVFVLLILALAGAAIRQWADNPSVERDIGTLLLVLWLPIIGNVVAYVIVRVQSARRARRTGGFDPQAPFTPHLLVEVTPVDPVRPALPPLSDAERNCTLVIGNEGFTARADLPLVQWLTAGEARSVALQLLRPALALPRLPAGAAFSLLAGRSVAAGGRVLQVNDWNKRTG
jgi:hypothetical protein